MQRRTIRKVLEERLYKKWMDNGYFHAKVNPDKKALYHCDAAAQCYRTAAHGTCSGRNHAGYPDPFQENGRATKRCGSLVLTMRLLPQRLRYTEKLKKEGIDKNDIGREEFLKHAWEWKEEYGGKIINQLKKLGASADWERERFTMDEGCSKAVQEVFIKLYEKGYIYKGSRIINWCPVLPDFYFRCRGRA